MLIRHRSRVLVVFVLIVSVVALTGCSKSGDGGGLSLVDKAKTASACLEVTGSVKSAVDVGTKVADGSLTQAEAVAQLEPIATGVETLAKKNAALPIGANLQKLSESITALQKVSPNAATDFQTAAQSLAAQAKVVVNDCAAIGQ
jgi:hypothetical protein